MPVLHPIASIAIDYSEGTYAHVILGQPYSGIDIDIINVPQGVDQPADLTIIFENVSEFIVTGPGWMRTVILDDATPFNINRNHTVVYKLYSVDGGTTWYGNVTAPGRYVHITGDTMTGQLIQEVDGIVNGITYGQGPGGQGNGSNTAFGYFALQANTTGDRNTVFGSSSMIGNTTGYANVAVGSSALSNNQTGIDNTVVGALAAVSTVSSANTIIGRKATQLSSNSANTHNTAIGAYAGNKMNHLGATSNPWSELGVSLPSENNVMVGYNAGSEMLGSIGSVIIGANAANNAGGVAFGCVAIGTQSMGNRPLLSAGQTATFTKAGDVSIGYSSMGGASSPDITAYYGDGQAAIAIGVRALAGATSTGNSIAIGTRALSKATSAQSSIAIGADSLGNTTTGGYSIAIGTSALASNNFGYSNVAIGHKSLYSNSTGYYNTAVGLETMRVNTTGSLNVAVGYQTLIANTTGGSNVALGSGALASNTSGASNIAIGAMAMQMSTTASANTAVGHATLNSNTTGYNNTAIGYQSLGANTTGYSNTACGNSALGSTTTGQYNVGIGHTALTSNTTGSRNIAIGYQTSSFSTTASDNISMGHFAMYNLQGGTNNIAIGSNAGYDAVASITTQNNYVVLGNNSTTNANIKVAWTVTSDARDKTEIAPLTLGLDFVNQLQPKQFKLMDRDTQEATTGIRYGFLAQDVLAVEGDEPVIIDNSDLDNLKMKESLLVPTLVKAIQELSAKLDEALAKIGVLEAK